MCHRSGRSQDLLCRTRPSSSLKDRDRGWVLGGAASPLATSQGVGSAVSSPSGVRGGAPTVPTAIGVSCQITSPNKYRAIGGAATSPGSAVATDVFSYRARVT